MDNNKLVKELRDILQYISKTKSGFSLILLQPIEHLNWNSSLKLIVSAPWLDNKSPKTGIRYISNQLKDGLSSTFFNRIQEILIIHSSDQIVKDFNNSYQLKLQDNPVNIAFFQISPECEPITHALLLVSDNKPEEPTIESQSTKKIFLFSNEDDEKQLRFVMHKIKRSFLFGHVYYSTFDYIDNELKIIISDNISKSEFALVIIGEKTHKSEAVNLEIQIAHQMKKPIIGMILPSQKKYEIPKDMIANKDLVVNWDPDNLMSYLL